MKSLLYFIFVTIITFQGCSSKKLNSNIEPSTPTTINEVDIPLNDANGSEDFSEFENEFSDEPLDVPDPLKEYNEFMTDINDNMIIYLLNPVSDAYASIIPESLRIGISNAYHNLQFPIRFANNLLQGKFQNTLDESGRFLINSTIGLLGFMDPAKEYMHLYPHNEDFGQTLGFYGVGPGFHIVLPFFGPSNLRDLAGITVDAYASPLVNIRGLENYKIPKNFAQSTAIIAVYYINKNSLEAGQYESLKQDAIELYPFLRDIYEQKRVAEIKE